MKNNKIIYVYTKNQQKNWHFKEQKNIFLEIHIYHNDWEKNDLYKYTKVQIDRQKDRQQARPRREYYK